MKDTCTTGSLHFSIGLVPVRHNTARKRPIERSSTEVHAVMKDPRKNSKSHPV